MGLFTTGMANSIPGGLPEPYWRSECGRYTLFCGDCLTILPHLSGVDGLITDPPFGIGFKYESHNDSPDGYAERLWSRLELAEKTLNPGSPVFVWQASPNLRRLAEWFPREWRIFVAAKNFVQIRPTPMQWSFDPVVVWWTKGETFNAGSGRDFHMADTTPSNRVPADLVGGHPCPRPLAQVRHIIEQWVRPGGIVLDCYAGSGTCGVAAMQTGHRFIGIEIEERYCAITKRRIMDEANHLFAGTRA